MRDIRIILADDHEILREGLKSLISKEQMLKVVSEASNGQELLAKLESIKCDIVVLDLSMPQMDGLVAIEAIHEKYPRIKILVLTMQKDHEHFKHAMAKGAHGYLLKEDAYEQLILGIKLIMRGKQFVSSSVSQLVTERFVRSLDEVETPSLEILSKREVQILKFIVNGLANKNIASKLKISVRTVETHRANLSDKLGIKNTAGLVKFAISKGLM